MACFACWYKCVWMWFSSGPGDLGRVSCVHRGGPSLGTSLFCIVPKSLILCTIAICIINTAWSVGSHKHAPFEYSEFLKHVFDCTNEFSRSLQLLVEKLLTSYARCFCLESN